MPAGGGKTTKLAVALGCAGVLAAIVPAREARADSDAPIIATTVVLVAAAFGWDVAFTAYDSAHAVEKSEPSFEWMVAQTVVTSPQAVLGNVPIVMGQIEKDDDDAALFGSLFLPASIWGHALATYSAWSMADKSIDPTVRWGISWMIGANLTLTTGMVSSFASETHLAKPWISVPEMAIGGAQMGGSIYGALHDKKHTGEWIGLSVWSGVLAAHGVASFIASFVVKKHEEGDYPTPYEPPPTAPPPPRPPPPKLVVPAGGTNDAVPPYQPVASRDIPSVKPLPPSFAPTPIYDGERMAPGVAVFGEF